MRSTSRIFAVPIALLFISFLIVSTNASSFHVKVYNLHHRKENPHETLQSPFNVDLTGQRLTSWSELEGNLPSTIKNLNVSSNLLGEIAFTQTFKELESLTCSNASLTQLMVNATSLKRLTASNNRLTSFKSITLPSSIEELDISENQLSDWSDFNMPSDLQILNVSHNAFENISGWDLSLATNLVSIDLSSNKLTSVVGAIFPRNLARLDLSNNDIRAFEIRETDVAVLSKLTSFKMNELVQANCPTSGTRTIQIGNVQVCVISDSKLGIPDTRNERALDSEDYVIFASVVVSILVSLWFVVLLTAHAIQSRRHPAKETDSQRDTMLNSSFIPFRHLSSARNEDLPNDIRSDPDFLSLRIEPSNVMQVRTLAEGNFAILTLVYIGEMPAIIKKLVIHSPGQPSDKMRAFMSEIRVCAKLKHRRIVGFLGIMWRSLSDLAAVVEYAPNGNVAVFLKDKYLSRKTSPSTFMWINSLSDSPSKLSFALQASEALVYLHSFAPSIIHGHIKASSLLLGSTWEIKLDRIGYTFNLSSISITDRSWTAPEVLTNGKYDEKLDIYSFGVVMWELDRCKLPFSQKGSRRHNIDTSSCELKFRTDCPLDILEIAQKCLNDDPTDRPTAMEVYNSLRKVLSKV
ncbi:tkl protein kinase [Plasmopara halstedii]|uniref:Tkl protein kinase n=1 Tax=Plasmopara halstedii TaxID=4781 RepID=A0A0P1A5Y8_PLAHL|nr:tkl protein kinase [Plasmopara halstedii]CEG35549.1 tkl protein kinase [Plasmopara halstedii]|eukprot:XP_024571918.1 tkl protein kinase [Plasmopara halstedii]